MDPWYLETKKCSSQLLGARKKIMTSIKCQKNCFIASKITKKMFPSYLELEKNCFLAISGLTNSIAAIWRDKKVDPCYLENKKRFSQLLAARKKIMTCTSQKYWFTGIRRTKKMFPSYLELEKLVPSYFEPDKHCCSYLEIEKSGSLLFGD